jgi:hypothetical protein
VSGAIALGSTDTAGILPVTKGGTGIGTQGIVGILVGNGTSNFSAVSTSGVSDGDVLAKTANGYAFITLGSATVPPIIDLQSGAVQGDEGKFLMVNNDLEPQWENIGSIVGDYLPLAGGRMDGLDITGKYASVLSTWIGETSGWYTGLTHGFWDGQSRSTSATSNTFRVTTNIGTQNVEFGDYIIRIHGYNTANSSETVDYYVYLTNTTNNAKGRYLQAVRGFRNKGSIVPLTFVAYGHDSLNDCLSLQFTLTEQKNLVLAVDFISHDLARGNIVDRNSYDYQALSGWNLRADEAGSGSGSPLNILEKIITDGAITDIPSGTGSTTSKILLGGNGASANPTWESISNFDTGLNAGIVCVNYEGKFVVTGNPVSVVEGGTGVQSLTPFAILAGGDGSNGNISHVQQLGTGTSGQLLVSGGSSALPTWTNLANISTGLTAGIAKIDSNGKLTSNPTVSLATEVTGTLPVTKGGTGLSTAGTEGQMLAYDATNTRMKWVNPEIKRRSYSFTAAGWHRIIQLHANSICSLRFIGSGGGTYSGDIDIDVINGYYPQISQSIYTTSSGKGLIKARIVYKTNTTCYIEIYLDFDPSLITANVNFELYCSDSITFLDDTTGSIPENYHYIELDLKRNAFGENGQFLKTVSTQDENDSSSKSICYEWATLPTIPSAPSALPLVDNETGALGTAGTYANADHQHPLPYAVQAAYKFYYPRKLGIGGAVTAEAQEYDGTADLILQVTEIDPNAIINTVPIEKGGTGASTAAQALTNLGAAASNHNHDSTYLKLSGGNMTGTINTPANVVPLNWAGKSGVATFVSGDLTVQDNVNSYVTGRRQNINLYDSDVSADSASPTTINHTAKNDTTVNIICGINEVRRYTRYINLPTPTADMLGDTITIYFTNQKPSVIAELFATCSTNYRIKSYDYSNFGNTAGVDANCKWSSGNVVQFTCINLENNGTTYYWRAVKLVEQSW